MAYPLQQANNPVRSTSFAAEVGLIIGLVKILHVPLASVLSEMSHVFTLVPRVIGWFGFLCWVVSGVVAWATVRSRGRTLRIRKLASPRDMSGDLAYRPLAGGSNPDIQTMPDNAPPDGLEARPG